MLAGIARRACTAMSGAIRRTRPAEHVARAHLDDRVTPSAARHCTDSSQRTGAVTCRASSSLHARRVLVRRRLDVRHHRHRRRLAPRRAPARAASRSAAGCISAQWNGALTGSGTSRASRPAPWRPRTRARPRPCARRSRPGRRRSSSRADDLGRSAASRQAAATSSRRQPDDRRPSRPRPAGTASCMNLPRRCTSRTASASAQRPRRHQRAVLAQRVPGDRDRAARPSAPRARAAPRRWSRGSPAARSRSASARPRAPRSTASTADSPSASSASSNTARASG